jgi:hypothetical protein
MTEDQPKTFSIREAMEDSARRLEELHAPPPPSLTKLAALYDWQSGVGDLYTAEALQSISELRRSLEQVERVAAARAHAEGMSYPAIGEALGLADGKTPEAKGQAVYRMLKRAEAEKADAAEFLAEQEAQWRRYQDFISSHSEDDLSEAEYAEWEATQLAADAQSSREHEEAKRLVAAKSLADEQAELAASAEYRDRTLREYREQQGNA